MTDDDLKAAFMAGWNQRGAAYGPDAKPEALFESWLAPRKLAALDFAKVEQAVIGAMGVPAAEQGAANVATMHHNVFLQIAGRGHGKSGMARALVEHGINVDIGAADRPAPPYVVVDELIPQKPNRKARRKGRRT